ncbi:cysteine desulfurase family protein [Paenibacillus yanchengensis]|uniref:cysteine desulfurase n=1 Tax=Paenibacillus yanchengensis TaxID=2035833 RepID=A0ABW4YLA5_9BACL
MKAIYFDHAATTPVHTEVLEVMQRIINAGPMNSSSSHVFGRQAKAVFSEARDQFAASLGCSAGELLFTSGGTESINTALISSAFVQRKKGRNHLISSAAEHHAVLHTLQWLETEHQFKLTILPVDKEARISIAELEEVLTEETAVVTMMHGNNEIGTLQPIVVIGEKVKQAGALFHVDAVQTLGYEQYQLREMPVDLMSFSSHKINGPQGVGALYIAAGTAFEPLFHGGAQQSNRRAGTENIAGIAGFAAALKMVEQNREKKQHFMQLLRNRWIELLREQIVHIPIIVHGSVDEQLSHIVNISFVGIDTEVMLMSLDMEGIAASSGSACTSGSLQRSHVLRAMGVSEDELTSAVRFSFGLGNTIEELEYAAPIVAKIVHRIKKP